MDVRPQLFGRRLLRVAVVHLERRHVARLAAAGRQPYAEQPSVCLAELRVRAVLRQDRAFAAFHRLNADLALAVGSLVHGHTAIEADLVRGGHIRVVVADAKNQRIAPEQAATAGPGTQTLEHMAGRAVRADVAEKGDAASREV